jgi:glycosyltransferase involved in cell wall biosynthesis
VADVTVIIATYNCSRVLRCALESVRNQTFRDFDVWVVGDACTDDSEAVVAAVQDSRFHWTNLPSRAGSQWRPNNEGLGLATTEYVAYLGHDDLWFPWHLETLMHVVAKERADFAYGGVIFIGPEGPREAYGDVKAHAQVSVAPPPGWLHRRSIIETCGPWRHPDSEPIGIDVGFQARAFEAGFRFSATSTFSVLKFPSPWWKLYARSDYPQESYLARMRDDPIRLHGEVLTALTFAYARQCDVASVKGGIRTAFRGLQRRLGEWYGVDRWPLSQYLRWRSAHRRRAQRHLRGLEPAHGPTQAESTGR